MLTGTVPFDGDSTVAVAVQHIQDEIPAPSTVVADIPLSIDRIVIKCTQKKPDRRYHHLIMHHHSQHDAFPIWR